MKLEYFCQHLAEFLSSHEEDVEIFCVEVTPDAHEIHVSSDDGSWFTIYVEEYDGGLYAN